MLELELELESHVIKMSGVPKLYPMCPTTRDDLVGASVAVGSDLRPGAAGIARHFHLAGVRRVLRRVVERDPTAQTVTRSSSRGWAAGRRRRKSASPPKPEPLAISLAERAGSPASRLRSLPRSPGWERKYPPAPPRPERRSYAQVRGRRAESSPLSWLPAGVSSSPRSRRRTVSRSVLPLPPFKKRSEVRRPGAAGKASVAGVRKKQESRKQAAEES